MPDKFIVKCTGAVCMRQFTSMICRLQKDKLHSASQYADLLYNMAEVDYLEKWPGSDWQGLRLLMKARWSIRRRYSMTRK